MHRRAAYTHTDPLNLDPLLGMHVRLDDLPDMARLRAGLVRIDAQGKVSVQGVAQTDGASKIDAIGEPSEAGAAQIDRDRIGSDVDVH